MTLEIKYLPSLSSFSKNSLSSSHLNQPCKGLDGGPFPGYLMGWVTKMPSFFENLVHTSTLCFCLTLAQATSESRSLHMCGMIFLFSPFPRLPCKGGSIHSLQQQFQSETYQPAVPTAVPTETSSQLTPLPRPLSLPPGPLYSLWLGNFL